MTARQAQADASALPSGYLVVVSRMQASRDGWLMEALRPCLDSLGYELVFYDPRHERVSKALDPNGELSRLPRALRKARLGIRLLARPWIWRDFARRLKTLTLEGLTDDLREFARALGPSRDVVMVTRSVGGRIASLIADEMGIRKLVCLGYPFKHPDEPDEPLRTRHLAELRTPFLILQGNRDEYGGESVREQYRLSAQVSVVMIDTDHEFHMEPAEWANMVETLRKFLAKPADSDRKGRPIEGGPEA